MPRAANKAWHGGTRGGGFGNRFFVTLAASRLGRVIAPFLVFWVALYFVVTWASARRASASFAERIGFGGSSGRRLWFALRHFCTHGIMLFERLMLLGSGPEHFSFEIPAWDLISKHLASSRGMIMVTAHQGNWEAMGQTLARRNFPVTLVMHDGMPPKARAALEKLHSERSFRVIFTDGSPISVAAILSELREGRVVGMMGDRLLGGRGCPVPFLGDLAQFPMGPYALAAAAEVPLFHAFSERVGKRQYVFHCHPEPPSCTPDSSGVRIPIERRVAAFANQLESLVRRRPDQWGNFYEFWGGSAT